MSRVGPPSSTRAAASSVWDGRVMASFPGPELPRVNHSLGASTPSSSDGARKTIPGWTTRCCTRVRRRESAAARIGTDGSLGEDDDLRPGGRRRRIPRAGEAPRGDRGAPGAVRRPRGRALRHLHRPRGQPDWPLESPRIVTERESYEVQDCVSPSPHDAAPIGLSFVLTDDGVELPVIGRISCSRSSLSSVGTPRVAQFVLAEARVDSRSMVERCPARPERGTMARSEAEPGQVPSVQARLRPRS